MADTRDILLPQLGMLVFEGPDTRAFLQGQLTCDIARLADGSWVWGGYLTPKGRALGTFLALALAPERIGLVTDASLLPGLSKAFHMYLLRAKSKPQVDGRAWSACLAADGGVAAGMVREDGNGLALGFDAGLVLRCGAAGVADDAGVQAWLAVCANRGLPWLAAPLQGELTAHMLSLDLVGGVSFDKGCYVGQEIVVRAHHRGVIKKRLFTVTGTGTAPAAGAAIHATVHNGQVAGNVLYAAQQRDGFVGAASVRKDAVAGALTLATGTTLSAQPPPYGLIDAKFESA